MAWCKQGSAGTSQKLKKAFTYVKNREEYLMTYLEDGRCSLSNNLSENAIRPVTVGRKNWLFTDSPEGATANALCLTIVEMAKAYQLNLYEYLKFLLSKRPSKEMSSEELEKLAPWNEEVQGMCKIKKFRIPFRFLNFFIPPNKALTIKEIEIDIAQLESNEWIEFGPYNFESKEAWSATLNNWAGNDTICVAYGLV